jgi:rubrerythrin
MKKFSDLTAREVLAVAIASEEEDARIYMSFAENLAERYPESARIFEQMAEEEKGHRHMLLELYEQRFGPNLPPICHSYLSPTAVSEMIIPEWARRPEMHFAAHDRSATLIPSARSIN